jgi:hypothetical protein
VDRENNSNTYDKILMGDGAFGIGADEREGSKSTSRKERKDK